MGLQYKTSPPVLLLASEQATHLGARAEHSHWGWLLLALVSWKHTHLAVPTVLTHICVCVSRGVGPGALTLMCRDTHTAEGLLEQLPWVPREHPAAQSAPWGWVHCLRGTHVGSAGGSLLLLCQGLLGCCQTIEDSDPPLWL